MAGNKETSIGIKLVTDLRSYQTGLASAQSETKKFSRNVTKGAGDVKAAFAALMAGDITALPAFFRSATAAAGGFVKGLNGVKVALISTGIGAILVGLGVAIASITKYLKGTEEGQIVFRKVMNSIRAYVTPVLDIFGKLGKSLVLLFQGKFKEAWDTASGSIKAAADNIKENKKNLEELNALEGKVVKQRREAQMTEAKLTDQISELRNKANAEDAYSAKQRQGYIQKALELEKQLTESRLSLARNEQRLNQLKDEQGDNTIEDNDKAAELEMKVYEIQKQQSDESRRMLETQQRINKEVLAEVSARQKVIDNLKKASSDVEVSMKADSSTFDRDINAAMSEDFDKTVGIRTPDIEPILGPVGKLEKKLQDLQNAQMQALTPEMWQQYQQQIDATAKELDLFTGAANAAMDSTEQIETMSDSFYTLGDAIGGAAGGFLQMTAEIIALIPQLIAQIAALTVAEVAGSQAKTAAKGSEAIASGTAASQKVPFPLNLIALAATIAAVVKALATKPPALASGGIAYGDTIARVGEYSGARANPEVIAPLSKLKKMIEPGGEVIYETFIPKTRITNDAIVISYEKGLAQRRRRTGKK